MQFGIRKSQGLCVTVPIYEPCSALKCILFYLKFFHDQDDSLISILTTKVMLLLNPLLIVCLSLTWFSRIQTDTPQKIEKYNALIYNEHLFFSEKICLFFIILHCTCDERMALKIEHQMFVTSFLCFVKIAI